MGFYIVLIIVITLFYLLFKEREAKYYRLLHDREEKYRKLLTLSTKKPILQENEVVKMELVSGCIVLTDNHIKYWLATLRSYFGGNVSWYETLPNRARREAILRLKEQCDKASQIINLRIETSFVSEGSVEVIAYGTAVTFEKT